MDVNVFHMKSEDTDLFKEYLGNLSAILKVEKRQSSTRRRYSCKAGLWAAKKLFDTSMQNVVYIFAKIEMKVHRDFMIQDLNSTQCLHSTICAFSRDEKDKDDSSAIEEATADQKLDVDGESDVVVQEKISACREAISHPGHCCQECFPVIYEIRNKTFHGRVFQVDLELSYTMKQLNYSHRLLKRSMQ
ncbi:hypothetical protein PTKIN_Ptkin13bG0268100 [Pterospermum kingtungense]